MDPKLLFVVAMKLIGLCLSTFAAITIVRMIPDLVRAFEVAQSLSWQNFWNLYSLPASTGAIGLYLLFGGRWITDHAGISDPVAEGRCAGCGYDIRAAEDKCPECGTTIKGHEQPHLPKDIAGNP